MRFDLYFNRFCLEKLSILKKRRYYSYTLAMSNYLAPREILKTYYN